MWIAMWTWMCISILKCKVALNFKVRMIFELGSWVLDSYADLDSKAALRLQKTFGDWYSEHPLGTGLDLHWDLDYVLHVRFKFRFQAGFWISTLHLDLDIDWHADPGCASQFFICVHMELDLVRHPNPKCWFEIPSQTPYPESTPSSRLQILVAIQNLNANPNCIQEGYLCSISHKFRIQVNVSIQHEFGSFAFTLLCFLFNCVSFW